MTDNEIIKALECCSNAAYHCEECPFYVRKEDCEVELPEEALDIINRQKAEIERLEKELKAMRGAANSYKSELKKLNDYNLNLITANTALSNEILEIRTEATKEFAKALIDKSERGVIRTCDIPDFIKEWTEAEE